MYISEFVINWPPAIESKLNNMFSLQCKYSTVRALLILENDYLKVGHRASENWLIGRLTAGSVYAVRYYYLRMFLYPLRGEMVV